MIALLVCAAFSGMDSSGIACRPADDSLERVWLRRKSKTDGRGACIGFASVCCTGRILSLLGFNIIGLAMIFGFKLILATCFPEVCLSISNVKSLARGTVGFFLAEGKTGITNLVFLAAIANLGAEPPTAPRKEQRTHKLLGNSHLPYLLQLCDQTFEPK